MKLTKLTDDMYQFTDFHILRDLGHSTIILTKLGPLIIDTFASPKQYKYVENFIKEKGYKKPYMVFYTHGHFDHACGNQEKDPNYFIVGHENTMDVMNKTKERMFPKLIKANFMTDKTFLVYPNLTFKEELCFKIDPFSFKLIHTPFHTTDSITIFEETSKLAFTGDNFMTINHKIIIPDLKFSQGITSKTNEFLNSLHKVKSLNSEFLIQGHGRKITAQRYFDIVDEYITKLLTYVEKINSIDELVETDINDIFEPDLIDKINLQYDFFKTNLKQAFLYIKQNKNPH